MKYIYVFRLSTAAAWASGRKAQSFSSAALWLEGLVIGDLTAETSDLPLTHRTAAGHIPPSTSNWLVVGESSEPLDKWFWWTRPLKVPYLLKILASGRVCLLSSLMEPDGISQVDLKIARWLHLHANAGWWTCSDYCCSVFPVVSNHRSSARTRSRTFFSIVNI